MSTITSRYVPETCENGTWVSKYYFLLADMYKVGLRLINVYLHIKTSSNIMNVYREQNADVIWQRRAKDVCSTRMPSTSLMMLEQRISQYY